MAALLGLAALAVLGVAAAQSVATGRTAVGQLVPTDNTAYFSGASNPCVQQTAAVGNVGGPASQVQVPGANLPGPSDAAPAVCRSAHA
jgi:hypothetical protein